MEGCELLRPLLSEGAKDEISRIQIRGKSGTEAEVKQQIQCCLRKRWDTMLPVDLGDKTA